MGHVSRGFVNPRDYRSFCFRGEGRANFVISAKHRTSGIRIVWRFAKARKTGYITVKAKSELVNEYMERLVSPLLDRQFLVSPRIVEMKVEDVFHLGKIPHIPSNVKFETFEELSTFECFSFLPNSVVPKGTLKITALEMLDATRIPKHVDQYVGSTITVEIKPKQGFFQCHSGIGVPYCNNCILQLEKCGASHFEEMYDFCPLDLFSGEKEKVVTSLRELFKNPHRNLRMFLNGNLMHSDEAQLEDKDFNTTLFPNGEATVDDVIKALSLVLNGVRSFDDFALQPNSVLGQILTAQQIDNIGIVSAYRLWQTLTPMLQHELLNKTTLLRRGLKCLNENDARAMIERYLLAATMKDCSVMVSLRLLPNDPVFVGDIDYVSVGDVRMAYSVKVVDLDPKSPKNLINAYARFMAGVKLIRMETTQHKPCVQQSAES